MKKIIFIFTIFFMSHITWAESSLPVLKIGYAGHDHQTALYVACMEAEKTKRDCGVFLKEITFKKQYELCKDDKKIAIIEIFKSGGGSKIPTMMAQGHFELGFGGVAAFAFFTDKGSPMKIISPLHTKGDMLVINPKNPVNTWDEFITWIKSEKKPVRIGFKNPVAVAKLIFERALQEAGISFTGDASDKDTRVLMINMKGQKNLVPGLTNKIIDGYVANNPSCAIAENKGVGKVIADLNELPPGIWKDHPCCCVAATDKAMKEKKDYIIEFMKLIILATNYINEDQDRAVKIASSWLGTSVSVEKASIPTSGFSTNPNEDWYKKMYVWVDAMNDLGKLKGSLKGQKAQAIHPILFDFSLLHHAFDVLGIQKQP